MSKNSQIQSQTLLINYVLNDLPMTRGKNFSGLTVAAFESRMAQEMRRLIERNGGKPIVAPSMREVPLEENPQALAFGEQLVGGIRHSHPAHWSGDQKSH